MIKIRKNLRKLLIYQNKKKNKKMRTNRREVRMNRMLAMMMKYNNLQIMMDLMENRVIKNKNEKV